MAETSSSQIANFYADKSVFITGVTGFIGKVLLEKLLRSCSGLKAIYILLRPKKGLEPHQRVEELLQKRVFERVLKERPDSASKIVVISGDVTLPGLGISQSDHFLLVTNVSVVFHSAATVRFDEKLKTVININTCGTHRLLELCHQMQQLEAFIHVSTAYCNSNRDHIDEIVYEFPVAPERILDSIEWMDEECADALSPILIRDRKTTYAYAKALAENLILNECGRIPAAIVRPSIVTSSWKEPFPGWIDNYNGPMGLIVAAGTGLLRSLYTKPDCVADVIPVDVVVNLIIAVGWHTAEHRTKEVAVYNSTSGGVNKLTWRKLEKLSHPLAELYASQNVLYYPTSKLFSNNRLRFYYHFYLYHRILAYIIDWASVLAGHKPWLCGLYRRIDNAINYLEYFTRREWTFSINNNLALIEKLSPEDRKDFNFDIRKLHWQTYIEHCCVGILKYLLKEDLSKLPEARKNMRRKYYYSKIGVSFFVLLLLFIIVGLITGFCLLGTFVIKSMICWIAGQQNLLLDSC